MNAKNSREMARLLSSLDISRSSTIAGIEFRRVEGGVEIDEDFVELADLEDHLDVLFYYEAMDGADNCQP